VGDNLPTIKNKSMQTEFLGQIDCLVRNFKPDRQQIDRKRERNDTKNDERRWEYVCPH